MECKMSLVRALAMAALSARCIALSMVYNGDTLSEAISSMGRRRNGSLVCVLVKQLTEV